MSNVDWDNEQDYVPMKKEKPEYLLLGHNFLRLDINLDELLKLEPKLMKNVIRAMYDFVSSNELQKIIKMADGNISIFERKIFIDKYHGAIIKIQVTMMNEVHVTFISCYKKMPREEYQKNNPYVRTYMNFGMNSIDEE